MIKLLDGYYIRKLDDRQWVVAIKRKIKDKTAKRYGEEYEEIEGYYPNINLGLRSFVQKYLKKEDVESFGDIIQRLKDIEEMCERLSRCLNSEKVV